MPSLTLANNNNIHVSACNLRYHRADTDVLLDCKRFVLLKGMSEYVGENCLRPSRKVCGKQCDQKKIAKCL